MRQTLATVLLGSVLALAGCGEKHRDPPITGQGVQGSTTGGGTGPGSTTGPGNTGGSGTVGHAVPFDAGAGRGTLDSTGGTGPSREDAGPVSPR
jgi:hypothetical protein